jgi:hypothetical protein
MSISRDKDEFKENFAKMKTQMLPPERKPLKLKAAKADDPTMDLFPQES